MTVHVCTVSDEDFNRVVQDYYYFCPLRYCPLRYCGTSNGVDDWLMEGTLITSLQSDTCSLINDID